ncbi:MAG: Gldg family protein, partial [Alphaproteobacteria bacterium]|nr:Gldg family protein [Alphaproteobacteria bacterium]
FNLIFFWSGFEFVLFWIREIFSDVVVDTIISFSFLTHFVSLSRGLIELRDLVFFSSLIIFFNFLTIAIISLKTKGSSRLLSSSNLFHCFIVVVLLFVGFFSLNIIANNLLRQISYDFTEEKYLSLTKNTKDVLRKLPRPVTARLYYSPILGQRNPQTRVIFNQIKLMLKQYKAFSHGNFDYRIYMPNFLDKIEDRAIADGLQPIPLLDINQNALFGIVFSDNLMHKTVIPFFSGELYPFLEQDFTTNIYKLNHTKKTVGLLSSLPLMGETRYGDVPIKKWEIMNKISDLYNIKEIKSPEDFDKNIDVLMLVHPHNLEEAMLQKIQQQQKILLFLDVADDASRIYTPDNMAFISSDLDYLADYWNIVFYSQNVAADFDNSITVDETINYKKNPSFTQDLLQFKISKDGFSSNHRVTYKLNNLLFSSASMILPKNDRDISFFPLIRTSYNSAMLPAALAKKNKSPREILAMFSPQNIAVILAAEILSNNPLRPFDIIAVSDTDFLYDAFWAKEKSFLDSSYQVPLFDSANFVLNSLDYLTKNDDLIGLRGKGLKQRPLQKIEQMRKNNIYRYKIKENEIFDAIDGVRQQLIEVSAKKG